MHPSVCSGVLRSSKCKSYPHVPLFLQLVGFGLGTLVFLGFGGGNLNLQCALYLPDPLVLYVLAGGVVIARDRLMALEDGVS